MSDVIRTKLWQEIPEPDNPFQAQRCLCSGYDVYGNLLGRVSWAEYMLLLLTGEKPTSDQTQVLTDLFVALANPGPREPSVQAAMSAGAGGSTSGSAMIAAIAVGAGQYGGAHEVARCVNLWIDLGTDLDAWCNVLRNPHIAEHVDNWLPMEHPPGFDPNGTSCPTPVLETLDKLTNDKTPALTWLRQHRTSLEEAADAPLAMCGVAAAAMSDLGLSSLQSEMLYLLLRLPGAAAHAIEQHGHGWRKFPFFQDGLHLDTTGENSRET